VNKFLIHTPNLVSREADVIRRMLVVEGLPHEIAALAGLPLVVIAPDGERLMSMHGVSAWIVRNGMARV
jgi:hypothetical protein